MFLWLCPAAVLMVLSSLPTPWRGGPGTWSVALNPPGTAAKRKCVDCADPRQALGLLARARYGTASLPFPVVGVTGTNGKTTTTYLLDQSVRLRGEEDRRARYGFLSLAGAS